jgi:ubiquinone/menaquinone biosynthesis C-methylase UbiE
VKGIPDLPDDLKRLGLAEIPRVLKPGGRLLVLDMNGPAGPWKSRLADLPEAGFSQIETGETRFRELSFVGARKS